MIRSWFFIQCLLCNWPQDWNTKSRYLNICFYTTKYNFSICRCLYFRVHRSPLRKQVKKTRFSACGWKHIEPKSCRLVSEDDGGHDPAARGGGRSSGPEEASAAQVGPRGRGAETAEEREAAGGAGREGQLGEAAGGAGVRGRGRAAGETRGGNGSPDPGRKAAEENVTWNLTKLNLFLNLDLA